MTYEEALARFKTFGFFCDDYTDACDGDCDKCADMESRIIESLEKQIPMKPIKDERYRPMKCPFCHDFLENFQNFCDNCGQRIDHNLER